MGDEWIWNGPTPSSNDQTRSEIGTASEGPITRWLGQTGSPDAWIKQAVANQGQGLRVPIDRLAAQSQPVMARLVPEAQRGVARNPYDAMVANQSRAGQMALMEQMRAQMNGPSLAGMQGQRALAQSGQQALMQGGRAGLLNAQGAGAGLAGDVGQARLAEVMRAQGGIGGVAGNLRGGDLRSADAQMQAQLQAQRLADERSKFAASRGAALSDAQRNAELEYLKLMQRLQQRASGQVAQTGQQNAQAAATVLDIVI